MRLVRPHIRCWGHYLAGVHRVQTVGSFFFGDESAAVVQSAGRNAGIAICLGSCSACDEGCERADLACFEEIRCSEGCLPAAFEAWEP
ncbi:hypothetical protein CH275_09720 [Rhodococcus sp. 06-235-1A]|nr:hypothetical protein CH275_09720 [Rhodococcus sp. 06-235-1A]